MNFKLRQAVIDDSTRIKFLVREAHLNPLGLDWRRFTVAVTPQEGIIGCGQIKTHRDGSRELASVVVDPIWRGEGIAKEVINHLVSIHPLPVYLTCRSSLGDFYIRFCFKVVNDDLPPYFRRVSRLFSKLKKASRRQENLLIMKLD